MVFDFHTHRKDAKNALISVSPAEFDPVEGLYYSVGIHPWNTEGVTEHDLERLAAAAAHPQVLAVGEAGFDKLRGGTHSVQLSVMMRHIELSEQLRKPLVIHCVKCIDDLLALRRAFSPVQPWIWHGFRGNATMARTLLRQGFYLSAGQYFNADAVAAVPAEKLLVETDDASVRIESVARAVAACRRMSPVKLAEIVNANSYRLLQIRQE